MALFLDLTRYTKGYVQRAHCQLRAHCFSQETQARHRSSPQRYSLEAQRRASVFEQDDSDSRRASIFSILSDSSDTTSVTTPSTSSRATSDSSSTRYELPGGRRVQYASTNRSVDHLQAIEDVQHRSRFVVLFDLIHGILPFVSPKHQPAIKPLMLPRRLPRSKPTIANPIRTFVSTLLVHYHFSKVQREKGLRPLLLSRSADVVLAQGSPWSRVIRSTYSEPIGTGLLLKLLLAFLDEFRISAMLESLWEKFFFSFFWVFLSRLQSLSEGRLISCALRSVEIFVGKA